MNECLYLVLYSDIILRYLFAYILLVVMLSNLALPLVERVMGCEQFTEAEWSCEADDTDEDNKEEKELKSYSFTPLMDWMLLPMVNTTRHQPSGFLEKLAIEIRCLGTPDLPPERA